MRIKIITTPNKEPVPFNYQQKLVGTLHKWIGMNALHDDISLYSFSWLHEGKKVKDALSFANGSHLFVSFYDEQVLKKVVSSILSQPEMFCGMCVTGVNLVDNPNLDDCEYFYCASPIFIKRRLENGTVKQYTYNDEQASGLLKETLLTKMKQVGLEDDTLDIQFDLSFAKKKTKLVRYHGIGNKANLCPVIIKAKPETKLFAWNVGIGNCTGIGFGAIY